MRHREPLSHVPQVFRKRRKDQKYDKTELQLDMMNFQTDSDAEKALQQQFAEEECGRMFPLSERLARQRYPGDNLRIAALGVLNKPGGGHRVIHDGTHGVNVNNQIVIDNRLENPALGKLPPSWRSR